MEQHCIHTGRRTGGEGTCCGDFSATTTLLHLNLAPSPSDHLFRSPAVPLTELQPRVRANRLGFASLQDSPSQSSPRRNRWRALRIRGGRPLVIPPIRYLVSLSRIAADWRKIAGFGPLRRLPRSGPAIRGSSCRLSPTVLPKFETRSSRALEKASSLDVHGVPQPRGQLLWVLGLRRAPRLGCPGRRPAGGACAPRVQPPASPVLHIRRPELAAALRRGTGPPRGNAVRLLNQLEFQHFCWLGKGAALTFACCWCHV